MRHLVKLAPAAVALLLAARAEAQAVNAVERERQLPLGLTLPGVSVAGAEEPGAVNLNPAGVGFVSELALQYFHEAGLGTDFAADGVYLADGWGGMSPSLGMEWVRPRPELGPRYRKTTFGLAFGGRAGSLGFGYNRWASPDDDLDALASWDFGLTLRPGRHLSLAAAAQNVGARLGDDDLPVRYNFGAAVRFWRDTLTLSGDVFANDEGRGRFSVTHGALGLGAELRSGLAVQLQVTEPFGDGAAGFESARRTLLAVTWNREHAGVTAGGGRTFGEGTLGADTWLAGLRLSRERYRASPGLSRSVPVIDLHDALDPPASFLLGVTRRDPLGELLKKLDDIRGDAGASALVLRVRDLPSGPGQTEELRNAILKVKEKKPVVAYLLCGRTSEYWLATAATRIYTPPAGQVTVNGLSVSVPFLRQGLEKIGLAFEVVARGPYKNAPDPLVRQDMSDAQREATGALLDDLFGRQVRDIAAARNLSEEKVRALVDEGLFGAEAAAAAGLTDGSLWPDKVEDELEKLLRRRVRLARTYDRAPERLAQRWGPRPKIAVVPVEGAIVLGRSRPGPFGADGIAGSDTLAQLIRDAAGDGAVRAIVLRIDSPGGDGLASDLVWREVMRAREKGKVVVASMGDTAASGGYLVAVAAEQIVAEPSTLTGSIGVFAVKPDLSGLLAKVGVNNVTLKRGENATLFSVSKPWSDSERKLVEREVGTFYDAFLARVAQGRRMEKDEVERVAGGRVWTGAQALERRLVDHLGGLETAVAVARERAGIPPGDEIDLQRLDPDLGLLAGLGGSGLSALAREPSPLRRLGELVPELRAAALLAEMGTVVALPPEWVLAGGAR